jgi:hypothetical protein
MQYNDVPIAAIDPVFQSQLDQLKETDRRIYISALLGHDTGQPDNCGQDQFRQRKWQMPSPWSWDLNLFHISGTPGTGSIKDAFDRTRPNKLYTRALLKDPPVDAKDLAPAGEGRVADCQAMKIQIDHLAVQERAFRLRHATSIRCSMHAAVRRRGHSTWNDVAAGFILTNPDNVVASGSVGGPVGGIFTTLLRYLYLVINSGYNEGPVDINSPGVNL